jgi:hypothetical protein
MACRSLGGNWPTERIGQNAIQKRQSVPIVLTAVLAGLGVFHAALLASVLIGLRRLMTRQARSLAVSLEEIAEDRRCTRTGN